MDTSSASRSVVGVTGLAERIASRAESTWVLTMKTEDFARVAWLHGRDEAAELERRAVERFFELGLALVRHDDVLSHSYGSDVFALALCGEREATTAQNDVRRALAGIERCMVERLPIGVTSSWTLVRPSDDIVRVLERAAERARRHRDRREYAELIHDLATPVSAIAGSLAAVLDGSLDPELERRFLSAASDEAERIGRMLREFLVSDSEPPEFSPATDLADVLASAFDAVRPLAFERDITLCVCSRSIASAFTPMHRDTAVSLIVNLAANAIKHGRAGGRVKARVLAIAGASQIEIDDDGPGVADSERERIFEFGRRGATPSAPGWGIGLAQVRRIAREHGGEVCVERSPLGGARFVVRLPLAEGFLPE